MTPQLVLCRDQRAVRSSTASALDFGSLYDNTTKLKRCHVALSETLGTAITAFLISVVKTQD